jgi:hypothetical protein
LLSAKSCEKELKKSQIQHGRPTARLPWPSAATTTTRPPAAAAATHVHAIGEEEFSPKFFKNFPRNYVLFSE